MILNGVILLSRFFFIFIFYFCVCVHEIIVKIKLRFSTSKVVFYCKYNIVGALERLKEKFLISKRKKKMKEKPVFLRQIIF